MKPTRTEIKQAIQLVRNGIQWKPGSAERHLRKRKNRKHLLQSATVADYEKIIQQIVGDGEAKVYIFWYSGVPYVTIVTLLQDKTWLAMFNLNGLMETAFFVKRPHNYLNDPDYKYISLLREVFDD